MTDYAALAIDYYARTVTLTRRGEGSYNLDGEFIEGAAITNDIRAAVQPSTGKALQDLPEGIRTEARWLAWSRTEIRVEDVLNWGRGDHRVMFVWPRDEGGFFRAAMGLLK